jgi:hypothetical protein
LFWQISYSVVNGLAVLQIGVKRLGDAFQNTTPIFSNQDVKLAFIEPNPFTGLAGIDGDIVKQRFFELPTAFGAAHPMLDPFGLGGLSCTGGIMLLAELFHLFQIFFGEILLFRI